MVNDLGDTPIIHRVLRVDVQVKEVQGPEPHRDLALGVTRLLLEFLLGRGVGRAQYRLASAGLLAPIWRVQRVRNCGRGALVGFLVIV